MDEELRSKENQAKRSSDYSRKNECDHKKHKRASSEKRAKENQGKKSSKTSRKQEKEHKRTMRKSKEHRDNENKKYLKRSYHVELLTLFFIHSILQQRGQKFFHLHQQRGILH